MPSRTRHEWLMDTLDELIRYCYKDGVWQGIHYLPDLHGKIAELRAAYVTYNQKVR